MILLFDDKQRVKIQFITVYETVVDNCQADAELQNQPN